MTSLLTEVVTSFTTGLLSNTDPVHHQVAQELLPQLSQMSPQLVSYTEGCWKPELVFYENILSALNLPPQAVFFVDDLEENVAGAKLSGIDAVLFESPAQVRRDLIARGVPLLSNEEHG